MVKTLSPNKVTSLGTRSKDVSRSFLGGHNSTLKSPPTTLMLGKFTVPLVGTKVGVPYHSCEYLALVSTFCREKRKCVSVKGVNKEILV